MTNTTLMHPTTHFTSLFIDSHRQTTYGGHTFRLDRTFQDLQNDNKTLSLNRCARNILETTL